jgi:hypothetical protein
MTKINDATNVVNYQGGDERQIISLLDKIYGKWKSPDYWNWKYQENTAGFYNDLITLAYIEDVLAGHYTVIPTKAIVDGEEIMFAQSVDTATNPDYRRKGVFETIAQKTFENAAHHQIPVIYGVAGVGPSYYGFLKKLNWSHVFFFSHYIKLINYQGVLKGYSNNKFVISIGELLLRLLQYRFPKRPSNQLEIVKVDSFPEEINNFYFAISEEYKFMIKKDSNYLNYRISNPEGKYEVFLARESNKIVGCAVIAISKKTFKTVTLDNIAVISELIAMKDKDYVVESMLLHLFSYYKSKKLDAVALSLPEFHKYSRIMKRRGFFKLKSKTGFILYESYKHPKIDSNDIVIGKNWHYTHLDTDHV